MTNDVKRLARQKESKHENNGMRNSLSMSTVRYLQEGFPSPANFPDVIGESEVLRQVLEHVGMVAPTGTTVLITGETGTGKELIARAIHEISPRSNESLIKVNCAALPNDLMESELFGHEKGAFTGALTQRKGRFELADGGTLFLDEISELPLPAQGKLLRVLQDQEFERVGGHNTLRTNARVVAATNQSLTKMVEQGRFRDDLFYRLNVLVIDVPALRMRRSDIPLLARHFLAVYAKRLNKSLIDIDAKSLASLKEYDWPGNIRELQNVIERAAVLTPGPIIKIEERLDTSRTFVANQDATGSLAEVERLYILHVLDETNWKIEGEGGASDILQLNPSTLRSKMQKLGIKRPVLKAGRV